MGLSIDTFKARMAIAKQNFGEIIDLALSNASKPVLAANALATFTNMDHMVLTNICTKMSSVVPTIKPLFHYIFRSTTTLHLITVSHYENYINTNIATFLLIPDFL